MSAASGLEHLKPFLPGLESALEDPEVSEIMINGPVMYGSSGPDGWPHTPRRTWTKRRCYGPLSISPVLWDWTRQAPLLSMLGSMTDRGLLSAFRPPVLKSLSPCGALASGRFRRMTS